MTLVVRFFAAQISTLTLQ